jgi:alpha-tubulin suppressor-like RCC1 family protein
LAGVDFLSVAAGYHHSLALGWDGRVYSWGRNEYGQLGHGDTQRRPAPALVGGLEGVRIITAAYDRGLAVTHSSDMFHWGRFVLPEVDVLRPTIMEGFGECACATRMPRRT